MESLVHKKFLLCKTFQDEILNKFIENGELTKFGRGLYTINSAWEDDFFSLQQKYRKGIYSHDTALYLLGYSDRTPSLYDDIS